jgi:hypothetical protein
MQLVRRTRWAAASMIAAAVFPAVATAGPTGGALAPQFVLEVQVVDVAGIPTDAAAVALNITVTGAAGAGFLTVFPCGEPEPDTSNLNYVAGVDVPNAVISKVGPDGTVCISTSAITDVIVDISGYFPAGSAFRTIPNPERILDTRNAVGTPKAKVGAGRTLSLTIGGVRSTPASASAAVLNMAVVDAQVAGFATVYPCGQPIPDASNLNFAAGQTIPNLVISRVGDGGKVCVTTTAEIDVLADVAAYFPAGASGYTPILNPTRILDTRNGVGAPKGPAAANVELGFQARAIAGVPATATAVVLNVTATGASSNGFTTVYPCGAAVPETSSLNFRARTDVPNLVIAGVGVLDGVCTRSSTPVHLIADVAGYFEGSATYVPLTTPYRAADTRQDAELRCNLAVSKFNFASPEFATRPTSFAVLDMKTGLWNPPSVMMYPDTPNTAVTLRQDCKGYVAVVKSQTPGFTLDIIEIEPGRGTVLGHSSLVPGTDLLLETLDDGAVLRLESTGVFNARTGQQYVFFESSASLRRFGVFASFTPLGASEDGIAAYWMVPGLGLTTPLLPGVIYWDIATGEPLNESPLPGSAQSRLSPTATYLASPNPSLRRGTGVVVTTPDGEYVASLGEGIGGPSYSAFQWIGVGSMLVCSGLDGRLSSYRWDIFGSLTLIVNGECLVEAG